MLCLRPVGWVSPWMVHASISQPPYSNPFHRKASREFSVKPEWQRFRHHTQIVLQYTITYRPDLWLSTPDYKFDASICGVTQVLPLFFPVDDNDIDDFLDDDNDRFYSCFGLGCTPSCIWC